MTPGQGGGVSARVLGENDPSLPSINDALRMAWDLSWDMIPGELAQVSVSQAIHNGFVSLCKIEAAKVAAVDEHKDKILKLGKRKLASNGYNLCLKKMAKAFPEIDIEVLDHEEVSNVESEDFEEDEVFEDPAAPTNP
ncbi:hypothetical protein F0562_017459 [Nyssa sinensis]|uniref:Uncharacterized protein n=1 Tax=Nyssa sinensis TaxID=561372 RepID=A0A5J4ZHP7_9ASTE|nr:hypothetical protein F0562_017459 [Nyssa sinensis]